MTNIKGPRSALGDFISKHNIKVKSKPRVEPHLKPIRKQKKVAFIRQKEYKIAHHKTLEDMCIEKIIENIYKYNYKDKTLQSLSKYLARKRMANKFYFDFILSKTTDEFYFYDCASVKTFINKENTNLNEENINESENDINDNILNEQSKIIGDMNGVDNIVYYEKLKKIEMYFCGQLTQSELNIILARTKRLENLTIHGAYLINDIFVPKTIQNIDMSHCSRLTDDFVNKINECDYINTVKLSYCYGLTKNVQFTTKIKELYVCETYVSLESLLTIKNIEDMGKLSIKNCSNIFEACESNSDDLENVIACFFSKFNGLKYLDIEGISTITSLKLKNTLEYLNVTNCFVFDMKSIANQTNLIELNVSRINDVDFDILTKFSKLQILNISWCEKLDDEKLLEIVKEMKMLKIIYVFGCFKLTDNVSELARENRKYIKIIGNPAETKYTTDYM